MTVTETPKCPTCGAPNTENVQRCAFCGTTLAAAAPPPQLPQRSGRHRWVLYVVLLAGLLPVVLLAAFGVLFYFLYRVGGEALEEAGAPPPRAAYTSIDACRCESDVDGRPGAETMQLAVWAMELYQRNSQNHVEDNSVIRYFLDISGQSPWQLPITGATAPSSSPSSHDVRLFIACNGDIVAIASEDRVTGWDVRRRQVAWTTPLGGAYRSEVPPRPQGGQGFSVQCTALNENSPSMTVTTDRGEVTMGIADGRIVR